MNLHSPCPVTLPLLRRFLSEVNNAPCPDDIAACLRSLEQTAAHEDSLGMDLAGEWSFSMGAADEAAFSGETVTLPGTMDENGKGYDNRNCLSIRHLNRDYVYTGPATYQRTFTLPSSWTNGALCWSWNAPKKAVFCWTAFLSALVK